MSKELLLELGDIVKIFFKDSSKNNDDPFYIYYIDEDGIELINLETEETIILPLIGSRFVENNITKILLISRNKNKGYAEQHNLFAGKGIHLTFYGTDDILTGEIIDNSNDLVTIMLDDTFELLYIPFHYKGIPKNIPFKTITSFTYDEGKPRPSEPIVENIYKYLDGLSLSPGEISLSSLITDIIDNVNGVNIDMEPFLKIIVRKYVQMKNAEYRKKQYDKDFFAISDAEKDIEKQYKENTPEPPEKEPIIGIPENVKTKLQYEINEADRLLDEEIKIPEHPHEIFYEEDDQYHKNKIYSLEEQTISMLDDYLSHIPTEQRTTKVLNNAHRLITRYCQLRSVYIINKPNLNPLFTSLKKLNYKLQWIMPIVGDKIIINTSDNEEEETEEKKTESMDFIDNLNSANNDYNIEGDDRYTHYLEQLNNAFTTFIDKETNGCMKQIHVETDINAVSSQNEKYFKHIIKYLNLEPYSDEACINGFITLPYSSMYFSTIDLPLTSIYRQSNLTVDTTYMNLFRMINEHSELDTVYSGGKNQNTLINKISGITQYMPSNTDSLKNVIIQLIRSESNLEEYLNHIEIYDRKLNGGLSIYQQCKKIEPFLIYYDRLYPSITSVLSYNLDNKIKKFNKWKGRLKESFKELHLFRKELCERFHYANDLNELIEIKKTKTNIKDAYTSISDDVCKSSGIEMLEQMKKIDCAQLFVFYSLFAEITNKSSTKRSLLITPITIEHPQQQQQNMQQQVIESSEVVPPMPISNPPVDTETSTTQITAELLPFGKKGKKSCKLLNVAKIYINYQDLIEDNHIIIYSFKNSTIPVKEGDYAILLQQPNTISYYIRNKINEWEIDVTVKPTLLYDSPAMFCNLGLWCVNDYTNRRCVPTQEFTNMIVEKLMNEIGIVETDENIEKYVLENVEKMFIRTMQLNANYKYQQQKYTTIQYKLGLTKEIYEIIESPHSSEFIDILGEPSYSKQQQRLVAFCNDFTRTYNPHNNLESSYWRYCSETNIPLVPVSLYSIASLYNLYSNNIPKFTEQLELLKKEIGMISEDGDYIIDKHTGFKISNVLFDFSEDYDDAGFVIKTRDVIVDVEKEEKELELKKQLMDTNESKNIKFIIGFVSDKMNINLQNYVSFIVQHVMLILRTKKPKQTTKKETVSLEDVYLMFLTLGMIVISIQTSIPSIRSRKTFPGCKESFIGYPLTGNKEDLSTIEYVACIISFAKQRTSPWNVLNKFDVKATVEMIKKLMDELLLTNSDIQQRINEKTSYIISKKETELIPEQHDIKQWIDYLPPIVPFHLGSVQNITQTVVAEIYRHPTYDYLQLVRSKIYEFSFAILEHIKGIVQKQAGNLLLRNSINIPFIENACCSDNNTYSTLEYFITEDNAIRRFNRSVMELGILKNYYKALIRPISFISSINTKRIYPSISSHIDEKTIYAVFIYYIKRNKSDVHYPLIKSYDTLEENITSLRNAGISFNNSDFNKFLQYKFTENIIQKDKIHYNNIYPLTSILAKLVKLNDDFENGTIDGNNPSVIPNKLCKLMLQVCGNVDESGNVTNENYKRQLGELKTFLHNENKKYINVIKLFLKDNNSKILRNFDDIFEHFSTQSLVETINETIKNITLIYPSIILHKIVSNNGDIVIPSYWNLSNIHKTDIVNIFSEKYETIRPFYANENITNILNKLTPRFKTFYDIVCDIKYYYDIHTAANVSETKATAFDEPCIMLMYKYFMYVLLIQYIELAKSETKPIQKNISELLDAYLYLFFNKKNIINRELKSIADSVIHIKNIEKNRMLEELSRLTDEEHLSNRVLKTLKLKRWSRPKNLLKYTKSGYDEDQGIFDEDSAFKLSGDEEEGYDVGEEDADEERFESDPDNIDSEYAFQADEFQMDWNVDWDELYDDNGDGAFEDGDYLHVNIEELNRGY
jgi:hypothetical protein